MGGEEVKCLNVYYNFNFFLKVRKKEMFVI